MNWDDMRIFLAVARKGNLSAAARSLKVTQPTVGRRLRTLEGMVASRKRPREGYLVNFRCHSPFQCSPQYIHLHDSDAAIP